MTRAEQIELVRTLSANVADNIAAAIERGAIPEDWDGRELRLLLAEKHSEWRFTNTPALVRGFNAFMRSHNV